MNLWRQKGWVVACDSESFELTPQGIEFFKSYLAVHRASMYEHHLQVLSLCLPEKIPEQIIHDLFPNLTHDGLDTLMEEHHIQSFTPHSLSVRTLHPFQIFLNTGQLINISAQIESWSEITLPAKALQQISKILWSGEAPQLFITVDDINAFSAMPLHQGQAIIFAPDTQTELAEIFIQCQTIQMDWLHYCDLSPTGLTQASQLSRRLQRNLNLFLPENWQDFIRIIGIESVEKLDWPISDLPRQLQIRLAFLFEHSRTLLQTQMVYAQKWTYE